ncbi:MFS transporter [Nakamurella leprariae]|uniref:MFS transporter n=1 Tax=Nakamurella leprariae TaxID=2803911 RepID=A0A939C3B4_9ACTN|nr:MFS transporter [Nakamurella leprariae]MBM9468927.1 MFS transporter [Nakamurella leprariae]
MTSRLPATTTGPVPVAPVLSLLFATGWAANHFVALLPVLREQEHLSAGLLAGVFGLYAVGLLPGLLLGGSLSDRIGRRRLALPGAAVALAGTVSLLAWHDPAGLVVGRLLVGLGAGATISAGTAWATDRRGAAGSVRAGVALTAGFAAGPVVSGVLAQWLPAPLVVAFALSAALSVGAILAAARVDALPPPDGPVPTDPVPVRPRSAHTALGWALPVAPFVFTSTAVGIVTLPSRLEGSVGGPLPAGLGAGLVMGTGVVAQMVARRLHAGASVGVVGATASAAGLALVAAVVADPPLGMFLLAGTLLGVGYGLCLRGGLLDLATWAPPARRGSLTGVFYVCAYLGFGVPVLVEALRPAWGDRLPLLVLAGAAAVAAAHRGWRLRRHHH